VFSGSLTSTAGFTGSFSGTATSASYAANAELLDGLDSTVFTLTSSFAAQTASFTAFTASQNILNGTYATTGSNTFKNPQTINSNLTVTGSITAATLVVQTITSSIVYSSGSNVFGNASSNTQTFTGSLSVSGSTHSMFGNVVLGNTSSVNIGAKLEVKGDLYLTPSSSISSMIHLYNRDSTNETFIYDSGSSSNSALTFAPGGTTRMTINSSGNVGIGSSNITGKLMIYQGSAGNVLQNIVSNQGGSTQVGIDFSPSMTDTEAAANSAQASIYATDYNYGANIIFASKLTGAVGNSRAERMRISSDGNVGVGTSTTTWRLTAAAGSDSLYNVLGIFNTGITGTSAIGKGTTIVLGGNIDGNYSAKIGMVYEGQNPSYLQPSLAFYTMDGTYAYGSEVERMRVSSTGNVLIGSTASTSSMNQTGRLQVAGGVRATSGLLTVYELGTITQNTTITQDIPYNGLWLLTNGGNNSALIMVTRAGGSRGCQLVSSTNGSGDIVVGTTAEPSGGTYLRVWMSAVGTMSIKNVNAYPGPYSMTPISTQ
jgi:hypothetical protein